MVNHLDNFCAIFRLTRCKEREGRCPWKTFHKFQFKKIGTIFLLKSKYHVLSMGIEQAVLSGVTYLVVRSWKYVPWHNPFQLCNSE